MIGMIIQVELMAEILHQLRIEDIISASQFIGRIRIALPSTVVASSQSQ